MPDDLRTRLTDLIYGTVSWRDVNVPVAEEVADAVIKELKNDPSIMFMSHIWEALRKQNNTVNFDALADAVIRELGLQRLEAGKWADGLSGHRYITDWIPGDHAG